MIYNIPLDGGHGDNARAVFGSARCRPPAVIAVVHDAYWYASRLINDGWLIRRIGANQEGGFFVAETPRQRVVSVDERARRRGDPAMLFAKSIGTLATIGDTAGRDYLLDMAWLLSEHKPLRQPATLMWRTWHIPDVPERLQPIPKIRAAYWFAVTLTDEYGWKLFEVGTPMAGGGFIAEIPEETVVTYPASMPDDRTVASALARLLGDMTAAEVGIVSALVQWHSAVRCLT